jgi:hypothetical protein
MIVNGQPMPSPYLNAVRSRRHDLFNSSGGNLLKSLGVTRGVPLKKKRHQDDVKSCV